MTRNFVVEILSLDHLLRVARALLEMKTRAPKSLKLTIAIVAERDVAMRYLHGSDGLSDDPLFHELREVCK